jgi:hypothetical protein
MYDEEMALDELEKVTKSLQNGRAPEKNNINLELYKYAPKSFLLRLLNFYNIYIRINTKGMEQYNNNSSLQKKKKR